MQFYSDEIPFCHAVDSESQLFKKMWKDQWECYWKSIQEQHVQIIGGHISYQTDHDKCRDQQAENK